jgi:selenocysteine-specific elongation factor
MAAAAQLLPAVEIVACSARTGAGLSELTVALERLAAQTPSRTADPAPAVVHLDRVFTIRGAGTVVTGTLWSGVIGRGERLTLLPEGRTVRVRGVQVHDQAVDQARAGQRVAVNLGGVERRAVSRGDVLVGPDAAVHVTHRLELKLALSERLGDRERVLLHHGTRATPALAVRLDEARWQMRTQRPLIAADGDRAVVRRISPPDTLGGGTIVKAAAGGRRRRMETTPRPVRAPSAAPSLTTDALVLEQRLRAAGHEPLSQVELGSDASHLQALLAAGRAVRIGRSMYAHPDSIADVRAVVERIARTEQTITLARLRDELATSRKYAQALLEHLDAARVTRRLDDDSRVLRRSVTKADRPHR